MFKKSEVNVLRNYKIQKYELVPPEGGWGYLVALCITITFSFTFIPLAAFGIIFGKFLEKFGDEASATGLVNGTYLAFQWCSGLIANPLLQKLSYRKVGIIGVLLFLVGAFATIFVTNINQLLISFSVLQGLGFGLIVSSTMTAFNKYFEIKRNFVLSAAHVILVLTTIVFPILCLHCMKNYGFRGTLLIIAGINLNCLPAVFCLQPVKWHMKKRLVNVDEDQRQSKYASDINKHEYEQELSLLNTQKRTNKKQYLEKFIIDSTYLKKDVSVCTNVWRRLAKYYDMGLFLDPIYVNTSIGLALCLASDYVFITTLPLLLTNFNMDSNNVTLLLTIFFTGDVIGRILLAVLNAFTSIKARKLTLMGTILAVICRLLFVADTTFLSLAVCMGLLGSLRCLFQVNFPLIIAELYKERFVTAFSLFLVVCGVISLLSGVLIGVVKTTTESNVMVIHFLTALYGICAIMWLVEMFYTTTKRNKT